MESSTPFLESDYPSVISYYRNHIILHEGTRVIGVGALAALSDLRQDRVEYLINMVRNTRALRGQSIVVRSTTVDKVKAMHNPQDGRQVVVLNRIQDATKEGRSYVSTMIAHEPLLLTSMAVNWLVGAGFIKDSYHVLCRYFTNYAPYAEAKFRSIPANANELFGTSSVEHNTSDDPTTNPEPQVIMGKPEHPSVINYDTIDKLKLMKTKAAFFDKIVNDDPLMPMPAAVASLGYPSTQCLLTDLKWYGYVPEDMPDTNLEDVSISSRVVNEVRLLNSNRPSPYKM